MLFFLARDAKDYCDEAKVLQPFSLSGPQLEVWIGQNSELKSCQIEFQFESLVFEVNLNLNWSVRK